MVSPAVKLISPPPRVLPEPTLITICPPLPAVALPVVRLTNPLVPELVVPDLNVKYPLTPFTPASTLAITRAPLDLAVPLPAVSDMKPPV